METGLPSLAAERPDNGEVKQPRDVTTMGWPSGQEAPALAQSGNWEVYGRGYGGYDSPLAG